MSFFGRWHIFLLTAALAGAAGGCSPMDSGPMDEEKESHYLLGKARVNAMDYDGAIRAFEESLETNPHSAQAHYQLAMLYENQESDPAAAIYHYQQYLKYDPKADNAEVIGQHIASCKQQLASDVLQLPSAPAAQRQLEKLTDENRQLHDQLTQWQSWYAAQMAANRTNPPAPQNNDSAPARITSLIPDDITTPSTGPAASAGATPAAAASTAAVSTVAPARHDSPAQRTHPVARGETLASIARKHGLSLSALEDANPGINARKLRVGQVLNLPAQ